MVVVVVDVVVVDVVDVVVVVDVGVVVVVVVVFIVVASLHCEQGHDVKDRGWEYTPWIWFG